MPVQACVLTLEVNCVNRVIETHIYKCILFKPLYVHILHVVYYSNITDNSTHVFHFCNMLRMMSLKMVA